MKRQHFSVKGKYLFAIMASLASCLLLLFAETVLAAWPEKPINLIIPYAAGGSTDLVGRSLQQGLEKELGGKILVKNIGGAAGTLGSAAVAKAKPDGYTIGLLTITPMHLIPHLRSLPYGRDSWTLIASISDTARALMVNKDSKYETFDDFVKDAKENPGKITYGTTGVGSGSHVAVLAMEDAMGIKLHHIPDNSGAMVMKNMLSKVTDSAVDNVIYMERYDAKSLLLFSNEKSSLFGDIPTTSEYNIKAPPTSGWTAVFGPKGIPKEVVDKLVAALRKVVNSDYMKEIAQKSKFEIKFRSGKEFEDFFYNGYDDLGGVLQKAGLKK
jgi:tripartite-type tricarboxylate transporter receptor subunit TctC